MLELEQQVHDSLTPPRARRFLWLLGHRRQVAEVIAQMCCLGVGEMPTLDRQLQLTEEAIASLCEDARIAAALLAELCVADAALIHRRGHAPDGFTCHVCETGTFDLVHALSRYPDLID